DKKQSPKARLGQPEIANAWWQADSRPGKSELWLRRHGQQSESFHLYDSKEDHSRRIACGLPVLQESLHWGVQLCKHLVPMPRAGPDISFEFRNTSGLPNLQNGLHADEHQIANKFFRLR